MKKHPNARPRLCDWCGDSLSRSVFLAQDGRCAACMGLFRLRKVVQDEIEHRATKHRNT